MQTAHIDAPHPYKQQTARVQTTSTSNGGPSATTGDRRERGISRGRRMRSGLRGWDSGGKAPAAGSGAHRHGGAGSGAAGEPVRALEYFARLELVNAGPHLRDDCG